MNKEQIILNTIDFVKETLEGAEGGHDWFHIERVYKNALLISENEKVDPFTVQLGALLHDIADAKFYDGDESIGPKKARDFLKSQQVEETVISHIENIILFISYKSSFDHNKSFSSPELNVIQDADRLDALGALTVGRVFEFAGKTKIPTYDPEEDNSLEYKSNDDDSCIGHFHRKTLKITPDKFHTKTAQEIAKGRYEFVKEFVDRYVKEWNGEL